MSKVKNQKPTKKDEIRKNKKNSHPAYIYEKVGNRYKYIGLTHSPTTQGVRNIKLEKNPNPNDNRDSYARPKSETGATHEWKKPEATWKLSKQDKEKLKPYQK